MPPIDNPQKPRSRRERPAKPPLTRQGIIDAALVILRDEGLDKLTMRRVATAVDSGHASLYVYVRDVEDLHAQLLDELLGEVSPPAAGVGTWRDRIKALVLSYGSILLRYPGIARMAISTQPSGPNYLALVEAILALLNEAGVADGVAALAVDLLLLYPTAIAVEHSNPKTSAQKADALSDLAGRLVHTDASQYPNIARLGDLLVSGDGSVRGDFALNALLDGILAASPPATAD